MRTPLTALGVALALLAPVQPAAAAVPAGGALTVLLELDTEAAAPAYQRAAAEARRARRSPEAVRHEAARAGADQRARADRAIDRLDRAVRTAVPGAAPLYRTRTLAAGLALRVRPADLPRLGTLPGVRAVRPVALKTRANGYSVPLTGAPAVWSGATGTTGEGVRIGIVDSGIDYTHADFGGPGTAAAFTAVDGARPAPPELFPNAKVVGGQDLVGDAYDPDPSADEAARTPHPDPNPIDCAANGHGTHVAGTAAGYGVTTAGATYRGPYRPGLDPVGFTVGPGAAPGAQLYAIRVFGCDGSTDQLAHALDLAADPNGDGDLADRLDVVNLSLGSPFGSPADADALAADRLAELGTVVVAAAGNEGDVYAVGGSPGTATRALTVAASVDPHTDADGIQVLAPAALAGPVPAHWSSRYRGWATADVSGDLALPADQTDGCTAFSAADAARLTGKIAVLAWRTREPDRACGSAARADHAADAGAVGTLFAADGDGLGEIAGNERIPAAILARADGERLVRAAGEGPVRVRLATPGNPLHGAVSQDQPQRADTLAGFTSRGIGVPGLVKPDLAAPGETIWSAKAGAGTGGMREDGTSMATPHVAGLAALVRAAHPDWTAGQVKAALMNTATDTWRGDDRTGPVYGPERTGAGRTRADLATRTPAVAYALAPAGAPPGAAASGGSSGTAAGSGAADGPASGRSSASGDVTGAVDTSASGRSAGSPASRRVSGVAAGGGGGQGPASGRSSGTAAGSADASGAADGPASGGASASRGGSGVDTGAVGVSFGPVAVTGRTALVREVEVRNLSDRPLSYATSYLPATELPGAAFRIAPARVDVPPGGTARVTVTLAVPDPAALERRPDATLDLTQAGRARTYRGELSGRLQLAPTRGDDPALRVPLFAAPRPASSHTAVGTPDLLAVRGAGAGLLSALHLDAEGTRWPDCPGRDLCVTDPGDRAANLRAAGSATDGDGVLYLAAALWAPAPTPAGGYGVRASLDTDGDGTTDALVVAGRLKGSDILVARTLDARTGAELDVQPLNGRWGDTDTDLLDTDALLLPVRLAALRTPLTNPRYALWTAVSASDPADALDTLGLADGRPALPVDLTRSGTLLAPVAPGAFVHPAVPAPLLLVHHLNPDGRRLQVVNSR
ncbi:S8 family serine peptidase [Kitasatospora terrestris]|uniref:Peptidase S8 n=1 Tax=Kitasatospora terrestris TaxID=258051 RepID=A0ABP9E1A3_9ACTN